MFPTTLFVVYLIFLCLYLGFVISYVKAVSFNFPVIGTNTSAFLDYENSSYVNAQGIQLIPLERNTPPTHRVGRAKYYQPFHLWDDRTGEEASFNTHFTFVINSSGMKDYGDGLAFFLSPYGSTIPTDSHGGSLGLTPYNSPTNSTNPFVAVEFDTFFNYNFDTINNTHVGIDVKTIKSLADVVWWSGVETGNLTHAWINYDSNSKILNVSFTNFFPNGTVGNGSLSYPLNLKDLLPEWVTFGFSASTGGSYEENTIKSWDFSSSPLQPPKKLPLWAIILIVIGGFAGFCLIVCLCMSCIKRRKKKMEIIRTNREDLNEHIRSQNQSQGTSPMLNNVSLYFDSFPYEPKKIPYNVLFEATNNFSYGLGNGGFGTVYRGTLLTGSSSSSSSLSIAVKRMTGLAERQRKINLEAYLSEVKIISRLNHENVIQLLGWCHEMQDELLLVYEFMPNGSLDGYLFSLDSENKFLEWSIRYNKIVKGLTLALQHLHEGQEPCVLHRDIKSSNVLLDMEFNVKLGDFGLARIVDVGKVSLITNPSGTFGYQAPECNMTFKASKKSDIYSFGIVLLEIACGKKAIIKHNSTYVNLGRLVWKLYQSSLEDDNPNLLLRAADPRLQGSFNSREMERLLKLGLWCAHTNPDSRPSIDLVETLLNVDKKIHEIPQLPMHEDLCSIPLLF